MVYNYFSESSPPEKIEPTEDEAQSLIDAFEKVIKAVQDKPLITPSDSGPLLKEKMTP